jgi:hypothetical protein
MVLLPLMLVVLMGVGAFAIDLNNVLLKQTELQNAADAGALEGARVLYCADGTINYQANQCGPDWPSANGAATAAAQANLSQRVAVEVVNVDRGHWEFEGSRRDGNGIERGGSFTANNTTTAGDLLDSSGDFRDFEDLNSDPEEINAVRVITARQTTPIHSFFGRVLGVESYQARATAVAYVGFAGKILPGEVDWPIAMCYENVKDGCNVGRFINDAEDTGGWTNLAQPGGAAGSCSGAASANEVKGLIDGCGGGINDWELILGWDLQTSNGQVQSAFKPTFDCWSGGNVEDLDGNGTLDRLDLDGDGLPDRTWNWRLPVIDCTTKPGGRCNTVLGAVDVEILWIIDKENKINQDAPRQMTRSNGQTWSNNSANGQVRWNSFVAAFNLQEPDGSPAVWRKKSIYFAPSCEPVTLGGTGGANFGARAQVPVLVY